MPASRPSDMNSFSTADKDPKDELGSVEGSFLTGTSPSGDVSAGEEWTTGRGEENLIATAAAPQRLICGCANMGPSTVTGEEAQSKDVGDEPRQAQDLLTFLISSVVNETLEGLRGFDGSSSWLKRKSAELAAQLQKIEAAPAPESTEEFNMEWFGVAHTVMAATIQSCVEHNFFFGSSNSPTTETEMCVPELSVAPYKVAVAFVSQLQTIVTEVIENGGCHSSDRNRHFSRYATPTCLNTKTISAVSLRLMQAYLDSGRYVPSELHEKFKDGRTPVKYADEYSAILNSIAGAWVCSYFPSYQRQSRNLAEGSTLLWDAPEAASRLNLDFLFYCFYFASQLQSLMLDEEGNARGVVVPTAWMEQLLNWSEAAKQQRQSTASVPFSSLPGPVDTFSLMTVSPHDPRRHWLQRCTGAYQVIPESLFELFVTLFGAGPKYYMYGSFSLRERCLAQWKPFPLSVFVSFRWCGRGEEDGALEKFNVVVPVEDALLHSDMREVCHLAWGAVDELSLMPERTTKVWFAAINGTDTICIRCAGLYMLPVKPEALAICESGDGMEVTVQGVLQRLENYIKQEMPGSLKEWEAQTSRAVSLSLVLTLNNTNGDDRAGEITGAMEVAAHQSGVCGLTNVGNSCYMNSALQCLSNLRFFRNRLLTVPISGFPKATIAPAFAKLLTTMWSGQHSFAETHELKEQIGNRVQRFAGYQQQDASEFIEVLLDHLSEEMNLVSTRCYRQREDSDVTIPSQELSSIFWDNFLDNNQSFIPPLFFHQSKTLFTCLTCGESSTVFDNNVILSVSIKDQPQRRTFNVIVMMELCKDAQEGGSDASCMLIAPWERALEGNGDTTRKFELTRKISVLMQPDNSVRVEDVEEALKLQLLRDAASNQRVLQFFNSGADVQEGEEQEVILNAAASSGDIASRLRVEVRVMEVPERGRVLAWARCHLTDAEQRASDARCPTSSSNALPAARVWYTLTTATPFPAAAGAGALVWMDEFPSLYLENEEKDAEGEDTSDGAVEVEKVPGLSTFPNDAVLPYQKRIRSRCAELTSRMLRRIPAATLGPLVSATATSVSEEDGETAIPAGISWDGEERVESRPPAGQRNYALSHRILCDPVSSLGELTMTEGVDESVCENKTSDTVKTRVHRAAMVTTTIVVTIQYYTETHEWIADARQPDSWFSKTESGSAAAEPSCTLQECMEYSMQPDVLRGDDAWYCGRCKEFRETKVHRTLFRLPPCLIVSLKRFKMHTYTADKKNTVVQFPSGLDCAPYLDPEIADNQPDGTSYRLRGVVYHAGSLSYGHYTAAAFNDSVQKWVYYNDTHTTVNDEETPSPVGAYILCFERVPQTDSPK